MSDTTTTPKLYAKLVSAQHYVRIAAKAARNDHRNSRYAPLEEIVTVARQACVAAGLWFAQDSVYGDGYVEYYTTIGDEDGHTIEGGRVRFGLTGSLKAQDVGSLDSYGRRYSLQKAFGIASADEDDDGDRAHHSRAEFDGSKTRGASSLQSMPDPGQTIEGIGALEAIRDDMSNHGVGLDELRARMCSKSGVRRDQVAGPLKGWPATTTSAIRQCMIDVRNGVPAPAEETDGPTNGRLLDTQA